MYHKFFGFAFFLTALPVAAVASYNCSDPAKCTVVCGGTNDHADINAAISAASPNTTVTIAAGSCAISGTVTVRKAITLAGAGSSSTTFSGAANPLISVGHGTSGVARVTGINFSLAGGDAIDLNAGEPHTLSDPMVVRIDHNQIGAADNGIAAFGRVEGVVDHNTFINCDRCVYGEGLDTPMWSIDYDSGSGNFLAGGSHALFWEDNTFTRNASFSRAGNEIHYIQEGFRDVFRYNTVDEHLWTADNSAPWEMHGNQAYYDSSAHPSPDTFRGQPITEVYNNTFILRGSPRAFAPRSGSALIHDNTITVSGTGSLSSLVHLCEEETYASGHFAGKQDYVWPNEDMVTNTFIWNNTVNGSALTTANVDGASGLDCCSTNSDASHVIKFDRDVWMHAPQASGGRTYYNGRPGASGRDNDGTLVFTTSGPNAYYPYTPSTYPHPLITATTGTTGSSPPTGIVVTVY